MKTIIFLMIFLYFAEISLARKTSNFLKLANCPEFKNSTIIYKNVRLTKNKQGKTVAIKFDVIFKEEVKRMMVKIDLRKCENSENLDSCEFYMKDFKINNVCEIIGQKNQLWSKVVSNSNFPSSCPIPQGRYYLNDTKFESGTRITLISIPMALWRIKIFVYDSENNNLMVCCTDIDVNIFNDRRH